MSAQGLRLRMLAPPSDIRGRFRWGLMYFGLLNYAAFAGLSVFGTAPAQSRLLTVACLAVLGLLTARAFLRDGPTVVVDLATTVLMGASAFGFGKVTMVGSLLFGWLTWVQLYGAPWRAILRLALGYGMWLGVVRLAGEQVARESNILVGVVMASVFSWSLGAALGRVQASEARFRSLVQNASDLTMVAAVDGRLTYLSPPAEALLGLKAGGNLGAAAAESDRPRLLAMLEAASRTGKVQRLELQLRGPDGGLRDCEALATNQLDNPDIQGLVLNVRDVTERKAAEQQARVSEAALRDVKHEVEIAARIQTSLLPPERKLQMFDVAAVMLPASEVGGDYYDIIPVDGAVYVGVGDVAGHGLTAGLIMLMTQSVVSALVHANPKAAPGDIVRHLNHVLFENIRGRLGNREHVTFTLLRIADDGTVLHAGAHEELLVRRGRTVEAVPTRGVWLGAVADVAATTVEGRFALAKGDVLLLHTDGITEARNAAAEEYGSERLAASLAGLNGAPAQAMCARMAGEVEAFAPVRQDDRSLVVVRYLGA